MLRSEIFSLHLFCIFYCIYRNRNKYGLNLCVPFITMIVLMIYQSYWRNNHCERAYTEVDGKNLPLSILSAMDWIIKTTNKDHDSTDIRNMVIFKRIRFMNEFAIDSVDEIMKYMNYGRKHIIDVDIWRCFENITKHKFIEQVARRILDKTVLQLIRKFINAGIMGW